MGKHRLDPEFEGELPEAGEKKEQLSEKRDPEEPGMGEVSTSPIETY